MRKTKTIMTVLSMMCIIAFNSISARAEENTAEASYEGSVVVSGESANETDESTSSDISAQSESVSVTEENSIEEIGPGVVMEEVNKTEEKKEEIPEISKGEQVAVYAAQFIGNPYVYGGTSLTKGADCSGFVMRVFEQFGAALPRTSGEQGRVGMDVGGLENAQPGDIVSYKGHIGIYGGENKLVHASNPKGGIKVSPVTYKPILSIRRVL